MTKFRDRRLQYPITIAFSLVAIAIEYFYSACETACSSLIGDIFGIELQYIGIGYMIALIALAVLKQDALLLILLSVGVGVEFYLVGFQIWRNTYCDYCLAFAGVLVLQFIVNFDRRKWKLILLPMAGAFILFPIVFKGYTAPVYAGHLSIQTSGMPGIYLGDVSDLRTTNPAREPILRTISFCINFVRYPR